MNYGIQDFVQEWKMEASLTAKVLKALTDESLGQEVAPGFNTLGRLAWHLPTSLHHILAQAGLQFESPGNGGEPTSAAAIAEAYDRTSAAMLDAVQTQWNDAKLAETIHMFGMEWTGFTTLRMVVMHQAHHRGQMTVLMRQAGLVVPGVYGPSKEEAEAMRAMRQQQK